MYLHAPRSTRVMIPNLPPPQCLSRQPDEKAANRTIIGGRGVAHGRVRSLPPSKPPLVRPLHGAERHHPGG
jgi:hypothetical protein